MVAEAVVAEAMRRALAASAVVHGTTSPNPPVGRGGARRVGRGGRGGRHGAARRPARRGDGAARGGGAGPRRHGRDHPGAVRAPRPHAALHRRAARGRGGRGGRSRWPTRTPPPAAAPRCCAPPGIAVREGTLAEQVRRGPLRAWLHAVRAGRPHVTWKLAATLDGRSAAADGTSRWITGEAARAEVHALRATVDAIVVGTGTVLADDPALTARHPDGSLREHQPLRVVVGHRDVPPGYALAAPDVLHLRTRDPDVVLAALHERGLVDVLLEGGPRLAGGVRGRPPRGPGAGVPRPGAARGGPGGAGRRRGGNDRRDRAVARGRGAPGRRGHRRRCAPPIGTTGASVSRAASGHGRRRCRRRCEEGRRRCSPASWRRSARWSRAREHRRRAGAHGRGPRRSPRTPGTATPSP